MRIKYVNDVAFPAFGNVRLAPTVPCLPGDR